MTSILCASVLHAVIFATGATEVVADIPPATAKAEQAVSRSELPASHAKSDVSSANSSADKSGKADVKTESYDVAHQETVETGKPIIVMVGTDWCGPCQTMKKKILPQVRERGLLKKVAFAIVNADREHELAQRLTGGGPIPQLVMFRKTSEGWKRRKLVGGQSVEQVQEFIKEGLALDESDREISADAEDEADSPSEKTDKTS
jgi:thioredoxin-like negative regulator of GroEL